jgi:Uri superfamily endonuclease
VDKGSFSKTIMACYLLLIEVEEELLLTIGKLGTFRFKPGFYLYVGSARKNLPARINRHLSQNKKLHWHIDYLLTQGKVTKIISIKENEECKIACIIRKISGVFSPISGFGSSDCRCPTHLYYIQKRDKWETILTSLQNRRFTIKEL